MTREKLLNQIAAYIPYNEQEAADRELILHWIQDHDDAFTRQNQVAHITASAWVVNRDRRKVLLVFLVVAGRARGRRDRPAGGRLAGSHRGSWYCLCASCITGHLFAGIPHCGRACQKGAVCIQPPAFKRHLPIGGRLQ